MQFCAKRMYWQVRWTYTGNLVYLDKLFTKKNLNNLKSICVTVMRDFIGVHATTNNVRNNKFTIRIIQVFTNLL